MDLNRLYFEHQLSLIRAHGADDGDAREDYHARADALASRISDYHEDAGVNAVPLLPAEAV
jgi:hypothetical protein